MNIEKLEEFTQNNKSELQDFFQQARKSREVHNIEDRILALEMMTCAIAASLEGKSRENFLTMMNSHSHVNNPMKNSSFKAVADLNVLSANFISEFEALKNK
ncbi:MULTISPECIES: hypothetical protein [Providencia]|uniref:hypothetical protein n=1 Tax=Providencia TaxID=586 RepID=UPI0012B61434|nr:MULTISPECIES: hypothetical protein [Providencia]MTC43659.1 hypothetical protein [Providencia sp. wls1921]CAG9421005.1 hypothetical protein NVI2019_GHJFPKLH_01973 [Providencia alcalifaciens]